MKKHILTSPSFVQEVVKISNQLDESLSIENIQKMLETMDLLATIAIDQYFRKLKDINAGLKMSDE